MIPVFRQGFRQVQRAERNRATDDGANHSAILLPVSGGRPRRARRRRTGVTPVFNQKFGNRVHHHAKIIRGGFGRGVFLPCAVGSRSGPYHHPDDGDHKRRLDQRITDDISHKDCHCTLMIPNTLLL